MFEIWFAVQTSLKGLEMGSKTTLAGWGGQRHSVKIITQFELTNTPHAHGHYPSTLKLNKADRRVVHLLPVVGLFSPTNMGGPSGPF